MRYNNMYNAIGLLSSLSMTTRALFKRLVVRVCREYEKTHKNAAKLVSRFFSSHSHSMGHAIVLLACCGGGRSALIDRIMGLI